MSDKIKIVIIGGGAAGMFASIIASNGGAEVTVIEKNDRLGKKLGITGKGRCNVTNNCTVAEFFENVISNPKFLTKALYRFPPSKTTEFFESLSVPLKTERGRRVFPVSDKASDIVSALKREMNNAGVKIVRGNVTKINTADGSVTGVECGNKTITADRVILCAGGASYPVTGSDGSGFALAKSLGHTITDIRPSLVPLCAEDLWVPSLTGLSLKNVAVRFVTGGKEVYSDQGEMLFTHFGVSGPLILSGSCYVHSFPATLYIDMKPALDAETLDTRLLSDFAEAKNKDFANSLDKLLPKALIPVIIKLSGIDERKKVNAITKKERRALLEIIKAIPVTLIGTRPIEEAIVTAGGVSTTEINPNTMMSKKIKNLYFAGEVIDVDCYTGGYNLQAAWSTAYLAAQSAALSE